jgi:hypothetical protein
MKEITKSEHDFYILSISKKNVLEFSHFQSLEKKNFFLCKQKKTNFKKLHKTPLKTLNFIHKHIVSLVLTLIIVIHHFSHESNT